MTSEKQSTLPRSGHTTKEIEMQMNQHSPALMVRCHGGARRKSISELLDDVRVSDPVWFARFEDARLSVAASADLMDVLELVATAPGGPNGRLAGFIEGLYVNN